jgi:hypothetical protein
MMADLRTPMVDLSAGGRCRRRRLEPVFDLDAWDMSEVPDVTRHQSKVLQQIPALIELGRRWPGRAMPLCLNFLHNLEEGIIVWNAVGVVVGAVRKAFQFPPQGTPEISRMSGQLGANRPLVLRGEALNQLNHMQCRRAHREKLPLPPEIARAKQLPKSSPKKNFRPAKHAKHTKKHRFPVFRGLLSLFYIGTLFEALVSSQLRLCCTCLRRGSGNWRLAIADFQFPTSE